MEGHIPVLKEEVLQTFGSVSGTLLDGTFGGGGHTQALLEANTDRTIIALDIDPEAQNRAGILQKIFDKRLQFHPINFSQLSQINQSFDGILLDLGVSSYQLDNAERGFSFQKTGPLDMRMNPNAGLSAKDFLKKATLDELTTAFRDYGEEPQWRSVVRAVLQFRDIQTWETTTDFVDFLKKHTFIHRSKKPGIHPATRVFQGLRIAVNDELNHLNQGLQSAFATLKKGGIMAVITFHSLEDRIVKQNFYAWCGRSLSRDDAQPRQLKNIQAELLTRKPKVATEEEIGLNPRARSAKLRSLRKL